MVEPSVPSVAFEPSGEGVRSGGRDGDGKPATVLDLRRVQELRADRDLDVAERVCLWVDTDDPDLRAAVDEHRERLREAVRVAVFLDELPPALASGRSTGHASSSDWKRPVPGRQSSETV